VRSDKGAGFPLLTFRLRVSELKPKFCMTKRSPSLLYAMTASYDTCVRGALMALSSASLIGRVIERRHGFYAA
jgi:hypothetical protein